MKWESSWEFLEESPDYSFVESLFWPINLEDTQVIAKCTYGTQISKLWLCLLFPEWCRATCLDEIVSLVNLPWGGMFNLGAYWGTMWERDRKTHRGIWGLIILWGRWVQMALVITMTISSQYMHCSECCLGCFMPSFLVPCILKIKKER
jgi:hypothetical protein